MVRSTPLRMSRPPGAATRAWRFLISSNADIDPLLKRFDGLPTEPPSNQSQHYLAEGPRRRRRGNERSWASAASPAHRFRLASTIRALPARFALLLRTLRREPWHKGPIPAAKRRSTGRHLTIE